MKKLMISLALLFVVSLSFAHDIQQGCWRQGRFSATLSNVDVGLTVHITTDNGFDSTFVTVVNTPVTFTVPQPDINVGVTVHLSFSDGVETGFITNSGLANDCSVLPLSISGFKVVKIDDNTARVYLTIYDVSNVNYVNVKMSLDGKIYKVVGVIKPENRSDSKQYYLDVKLKK